MKLPNGDHAIVEMSKLKEYCLNPHHPQGKHKARVFKASLGLTGLEAEALRQALLHAAQQQDARVGISDQYGHRYIIDFEMSWADRVAMVRSSWIIRTGELRPRFVTCFVC